MRKIMGTRRWILSLVLPAGVIYAYRCIPGRIRGSLGQMTGVTCSTSRIGLDNVKAGGGWPAFWSAYWSCGRTWE